jgi:replicative DNA helicase
LGLDYFKDLDQHFLDICKLENKVAFDYEILDAVTNGGITRGEKSLNVLAAPPGLGKSMFLANFATNYLKQGLTVFIISLEMSDNMYACRIDAHLAEFNINELKFHPEDCKTKIRSFADLHPSARLVIKDWPPGVISTAQVKVWLDKYRMLGVNPDILIVDYMNLMQPNYRSKNANSYEKVGDIGRELRALSFELGGVPVLTATQFNRSGVNNTDHNMSNISESMATAATADFLGALWQNDGDVEAGQIHMNVLKNRWGGKVGTVIDFEVDYNTLRVLDAGGQINGGGSVTSTSVTSASDSGSIVDSLVNSL